jgi:DNA polymerase III subunit alpha
VDLFDFCPASTFGASTSSVIEALVQSGAFDARSRRSEGRPSRTRLCRDRAAIDGARRSAPTAKAGRPTSSASWRGRRHARGGVTTRSGHVSPIDAWDSRELLAREKSPRVLRVGHPLDRYADELRRFCSATIETLGTLSDGASVAVGGAVESYRERNTKTGARMAFFVLEDPSARVEVIVRPRTLEQEGVRDILNGGEPVVVTGVVQHERDRNGSGASDDERTEAKIILQEVATLAESFTQRTTQVRVKVSVDRVDRDKLQSLRDTLERHPGTCPVMLELLSDDRWAVSLPDTGLRVTPSDGLLASLERLFGEKVCELR